MTIKYQLAMRNVGLFDKPLVCQVSIKLASSQKKRKKQKKKNEFVYKEL